MNSPTSFQIGRHPAALTLRRRRGRILDPRWYESNGPGAVVGATAYHAEGLVVATRDAALQTRIRRALTEIADGHGCRCRFSGSGVEFVPDGDRSSPDPWAVLTAVRGSGDVAISSSVGLDHLLTQAEQPGGNPFAIGHGTPGLDRYGLLGYPGRGPVAWVGRPLRVEVPARRPRVVVLDSGIGPHPWFVEDPAVTRVRLAGGGTIGPEIDGATITSGGADDRGTIGDVLLGSLGTHTGHGTFIAGLLRQECPAAEIVALAIMGSDGIVQESALTDALRALLGVVKSDPHWLDALVLSLGYYAETAEDLTYTSHLKDLLLSFGQAGVAVFCAAGNDATTRPSYPAAFAVDPAFDRPDVVPLVSVAALNANGTLASFSNRGAWVTGAAAGVGLVSSVPVLADGSRRPTTRTPLFRGRARSTVDPDDFTSGFASWSGTSFAAPVLAGAYLRALLAAGLPDRPAIRRPLLLEVSRAGLTDS